MAEGERSGTWERLVLLLVLLAFTVQQYTAGQLVRALVIDLVVLIVAVLVRYPKTRWLTPGVVPILAAALLAQTVSQAEVHARVVLPAALGLLSLVLLAKGVDVGRHMDALVRAVGRGLETVVGTATFCLIVLPGWAWTKLRRRDPLVRAPRGWSDPSGTRANPSSLASSPEVIGTRRTFFGKVTWAAGCVLLLMLVDLGAGMGWDRAFPTTPVTPSTPEAPPVPEAPRAAEGQMPRDPRNDVPAMAAYPWRERYFDDIQRTLGGYWPYTEYRPSDFTSPYVNQKGWIRASYQPKGDLASMPRIWMFGGSTTWGEGQRDQFTIASWIARIAEEEGVPVRIDNYGERGWTHFQEMILYLQQLSLRTPPDLAIFYDGLNEITTQSLVDEAVPSHVLVQPYARKLLGTTVATEVVQDRPKTDEFDLSDLRAEYAKRSAINKLVGWFRGSAAGASPAERSGNGDGNSDGDGEGDEGDLDPAFTKNDEAEKGTIQNYDITEQDGTDAGKVYEEGKLLTLALSKKYDVEPLLFWQPTRWAGPAQDAAIAELTRPTIDISDALEDHDDVFIDGAHTNEEGARIMAESIWEHLEPKVRAWYKENG